MKDNFEEKVIKLQIDFSTFEEKMISFMEETKAYRQILSDELKENRKEIKISLDFISKRVYELPCESRKTLFDSLKNRIKLLEGLAIGIILAIIAVWAKK